MKNTIFFLCVFLPAAVFAQTLTVKKVKGTQAIVEISNGATLQTGQVIAIPGEDELAGDGEELSLSTDSRQNKRGRTAALTAGYQNGSTDNSGLKTSSWRLDLAGRYGWNYGNFEVGPLGLVTMIDQGAGTNNIMGAGVFADYNFSPNKPGKDTIFGVGGTFSYSITTPANGGTKTNTMDIYPMGFMKWFLPGTPTALRVSLGYDYADSSQGSFKSKSQFVKLEAGFQVYF